MPSNVLPSEGCVFRLDSRDGYKQPFPMTFNDVVLGADGFEFIESNDHISVPTTSLDGVASFEIIFTPSKPTDSDWGTVLGDLFAYSNAIWITIHVESSPVIVFYHKGGTTDNKVPITYDIEQHVIITYDIDGGANNLKFYVNGENVGNFTETRQLDMSTSMAIGKSGTFNFDGSIRSASIYNRALTATEVKQRYKEQTFRLE